MRRDWKACLLLGALLAWRPGVAEPATKAFELAGSRAVRLSEAAVPTEGHGAGNSEPSSEKPPSRRSELNRLGQTFFDQGRLKESEARYREALQAWEEKNGPEDPSLIVTLNGLTSVLRWQGRYSESERLARRAIAVGEKQGEAARLSLAFSLNSLGALYCHQQKPSRAVPLLERALQIRESVLGPKHPQLATSWNNLANALAQRHRLDEAEALYRRSLEVLGPSGSQRHLAAFTNYNLAELYFRQNKAAIRLSKAEEFYGRSVANLEGTTSQDHPLMGMALRGLAEVHLAQRRYREAEPLLIRALAVHEKAIGPQHLQVAKVLFAYAELLRKIHNRREAAAMEKRAKNIIKFLEDEYPGRGATVDFSILQQPH